jgi:hypothetical protein
MRGAIPPFPTTPSWRGDQLKHRDTFIFYYHFNLVYENIYSVQRSEREADHSPPSRAKVKNAWSCTSTPPIQLHGMELS